ncbi:MAG: hypothetical protein P8177_01485, partial [Gemmatimonadota bacterium]
DGAGWDARGGWATVRHQVDGAVRTDRGELLAADADGLWLMLDRAATAIPAGTITFAEVTGYDSRPGDVVTVSAIGILATVSNGMFLIFTAPGWILTGTIASRVQDRASGISTVDGSLRSLSLYARFPQGMPPDLDPATLRPARAPDRALGEEGGDAPSRRPLPP